MGEVYRARDTKLNRDVAIKVLSAALIGDGDRIARFEREAQVLAALNHPNIAHLYGFEEGPTAFLVMEFVDGPTLADRITQALPLEDTLAIAHQIALALETAHEAGIVHRDLKPANVKVKEDGTVKVLDFGLAKALDANASNATAGAMNSPTLTARATQLGVILGTAAYMSPEQAKGKTVDRRADIWAFGVVLHEMLTGDRPFKGEDISDTLAAVLRQEVQWSALPSTTPPRLRRLLERCLDRDVRTRLRDIGEARIELARLMSGTVDSGDIAPVASAALVLPPPARRRWLPWVAGAAAGAVLASTGAWAIARWTPVAPPQPMRFAFVPSTTSVLSLSTTPDRVVDISPEGKNIAYVTSDGALMVRAIDSLEAVPIRGISGARTPFFSPDGKWIGYFQGTTEIRKVSVTGGPSVPICPVTSPPRGASWGSDDTIVFATADSTTGLWTVPAGGGPPKMVTKPDVLKGEADHQLPMVLPTGDVLFTILQVGGQSETAQVAVLNRKTGAIKTLIRGGSQAWYVEADHGVSGTGGYLVYGAAGSLRAVRFDLARLEVSSDAVPVAEQVAMSGTAATEFSVSKTGTLVYLPGGVENASALRTLAWIDRKGHEEALKAEPRGYFGVRVSPDGTRLALDIRDQKNDIWVWTIARSTLTPFTFDPGLDSSPVWTPDSKRLVFSSQRENGTSNIFWQAADGTGTPERLTTADHSQIASSFTPDSLQLLLTDRGSSDDIAVLSMDKRKVTPLITSPTAERNAEVSPDGKWLAYESWDATPPQVYVRPFPDVNGGKWQISKDGGMKPAWAPGGHELFFVSVGSGTGLYSVSIPDTPKTAGNPVKLFDVQNMPGQVASRFYDVFPDGQKFIVIKNPPPAAVPGTAAAQHLIVVAHWVEELKSKLSPK